ncbi:MAG: hypothetical protein JWM82_2385, partial [Myxococcales bacterium]|nr:hypothetical protein [Myxococcales bacterium]
SDGKTYRNECEATCTGGTVTSEGPCSVGKVTIKITVAPNSAYCDPGTSGTGAARPFIQILSTDGEPLPIFGSACAPPCSICMTVTCLPATIPAEAPSMFPGTELAWDGLIYETSTCGNNVSCSDRKAAPAGKYLARLCALPGKVDSADGGLPPRCVSSGPVVCVDVPFELPSATTVVAAELP